MQNSKIIKTSRSPAEISRLLTAQAERDSWRFAILTPKKDFLYIHEDNQIELKANSFGFWPLTVLELHEYIEPRCRIVFSGFIFYTLIHFLFISLLLFLIVLTLTEIAGLDNSNREEISLYCLIPGLIVTPFYINFIQRRTINWISKKLD